MHFLSVIEKKSQICEKSSTEIDSQLLNVFGWVALHLDLAVV